MFTEILEIVGNYVFPVAMCLLMFWKLEKDDDRHRDEMGKITEALQNNTLALQRLTDKMEG